MNQEFPENELLAEVKAGLGIITLNRSESLNALSARMITGLVDILAGWEKDPAVRAIFIRGAGDRAFCAGGDVKAVYKAGKTGKRAEQLKYFAAEYAMNRRLFHYSKPLIAFMDGITMGGGYGVAGNCKFRIATDKTIFAMPETGIGFFTDVGSVYHLSRCPGKIGRYLALTGLPVSGVDMVYAGLAEVCVPSRREAEIIKRLESEEPQKIIDDLNKMAHGDLEKHHAEIDHAFAGGTIEDVIARLHGSKWADDTRRILESRSPVSLRVCDLHLKLAKGKSFDQVSDTDLVLAARFIESHDFYEGIRAALVDKDRTPSWKPRRLAEFSMPEAESWLAAGGRNQRDIPASGA